MNAAALVAMVVAEGLWLLVSPARMGDRARFVCCVAIGVAAYMAVAL